MQPLVLSLPAMNEAIPPTPTPTPAPTPALTYHALTYHALAANKKRSDVCLDVLLTTVSIFAPRSMPDQVLLSRNIAVNLRLTTGS